jgi:hypothetical protein
VTDSSSYLLAELADAKKEIAYLRTRVRKLSRSRDVWKEKARVQTPRRRKYMADYMKNRRATSV